MKEILKEALRHMEEAGATYGDIRHACQKKQSIDVKNAKVESLTETSSSGVGVRTLYKGAWGFAGTNRTDEKSVLETADRALRLARAASRVKVLDVVLSEAPTVRDTYRTPYEKDPFLVPLDKKIELLMACDEAMGRHPLVKVRRGHLEFMKEEKLFLSTEGSEIFQEIMWSCGGISAMASDGTENQVRSFPSSHHGDTACRGWEFIDGLHMVENAERIALEAVGLLSAPQCPAGKIDMLLGGGQLALQIHESCGHPIELDRVMGMEASFAGTSFLTPDKRNNYKYGSSHVNLYADATIPGGLGTFGYDDEGVPAQKSDIVKEGDFVGYLTSRETATLFEEKSNATMRADGWKRMPLIRMTNINLKPGDWSLDEMIKDTDKGILCHTNRSWSIDQQRLNFQFGCEMADRIENGEITGIYKNPTYTGITPEFWGSCDGVTDMEKWQVWGVPNCGKGEPMQTMYVGHGCSYARFRQVQAGVGFED
jgi:TldD protein